MLQMRDLSDPATGLKMNWTIAKAGTNRNVIPADARRPVADVRVLKVADYDRIERQVRERVKNQLIPEAKVEVKFERRRPPLEATHASRALAKHAQQIYKELGRTLGVDDKVAGGGTDAAFAALKTKAAVVERFGLQGFGAHSNDARVRADRFDRAAALSRDADDHGRVARKDRVRERTEARFLSAMRLRHIEVFNAIMLTGSVSAAARLINITQPAVSRTLQHAEIQLGFALFQRAKGRLTPTTEALTLYPHIERLFAQLDEVQRLADESAHAPVTRGSCAS